MPKIDQKKYVLDILNILFPQGKYVLGSKDIGERFLESLKKADSARGRRAYAMLYSEPQPCTYKGKVMYTIEGASYYICSQWGWGNSVAYPVSRVIDGLCQDPYVTEEMMLSLREVEEQWRLEKTRVAGNDSSKYDESEKMEESESSELLNPFETKQSVDDSVSTGFWILVNNPNYTEENDFDLKDTSVPQAFRIRKNPDAPRRKELLRACEGDYVVSYESGSKSSVTALAKVHQASSIEVENDVLFMGIERIVSSACVQMAELKANEVTRESRFVRRNAQGSIFALSYREYKEIINMIRTKQMKQMADLNRNYIVFGAPGTGKSYYFSELIEKKGLFGDRYERVTFHPEYSYFDFVGSYKPVMEEKDGVEQIVYRFEAGPFARVLKKAMSKDSIINDVPHLLMIEEINRARVAAVFGDMFQLLDRNEKGESIYPISPARDLLTYLTTNDEDGEAVELRNGKIYIPSNMYIWATMNSADQGVYPMDTAFKRRWCFKYFDINHGENELACGSALYKEWNIIRKRINELLQFAGINEDKQMGAFFVAQRELQDETSFISSFKSKVIMYLYEDAAKHKRMAVFKDPSKRYSELCQDFEKTCVDGVSATSIIQSLFRV